MEKINKQHVQLPNNMTKSGELSPKDIVIYVYIKRHANGKSKEAFPSLKTLSEESGAAINTIRKCISNLVDKNKITIRKDGRKNIYRFVNFNDGYEPLSFKFLDKKDLSFTEKAYLMLSQQYMFKEDGEGKISMTNKRLSENINMPTQTISKCNHSLKDKGYLDIVEEVDPFTKLTTKVKNIHLTKLEQAIVFILKNHEDRLNENTEDINILKSIVLSNPEFKKEYEKLKKVN